MNNLALSSTRTTGQALTDGIRLGAGPGAATFVLGLAFGAAASAAGWGGAVPLVFSVLACSGSAQFTLLATLPAGAMAAVAAAVLINARYFVMSVALNDSLRGGRVRRALQAQALLDASFACGTPGKWPVRRRAARWCQHPAMDGLGQRDRRRSARGTIGPPDARPRS